MPNEFKYNKDSIVTLIIICLVFFLAVLFCGFHHKRYTERKQKLLSYNFNEISFYILLDDCNDIVSSELLFIHQLDEFNIYFFACHVMANQGIHIGHQGRLFSCVINECSRKNLHLDGNLMTFNPIHKKSKCCNN